VLVTGPSSVLPFQRWCSSRADAAAAGTSVRVCSVIVDGGVLPASSPAEKERAPLRYAGLGLGSAALRCAAPPLVACMRRHGVVLVPLCRVRLHRRGFRNRTPPGAREVASAISTATTWNDGSMSYKVKSVERAQLLETRAPRVPAWRCPPCAGVWPVRSWQRSPRHIRAPHSAAGRRPRGSGVVARADHCTGGHRRACGRRHRRGGDRSKAEVAPALDSPWTRSVCRASPLLSEMRPSAVQCPTSNHQSA